MYFEVCCCMLMNQMLLFVNRQISNFYRNITIHKHLPDGYNYLYCVEYTRCVLFALALRGQDQPILRNC